MAYSWRTAGVREIVTVPLYLTVLLALPDGAPFPATKEEMLRRFVAVHEDDNQRTAALAPVTHGLHQRFLEDLAATATRAGNTTIVETVARKSVSGTDNALVADGQITEKPQPDVRRLSAITCWCGRATLRVTPFNTNNFRNGMRPTTLSV